MNLGLNGKVALVTGAAGGIGAAVVRGLVQAGARVGALDVTVSEWPESQDQVLPLACDVTRADQVKQAVDQLVDHFSAVDLLVECAGIFRDKVLWKLTDEDWDQVVDVNLSGSFHVLREVVPYFRERGGGAVVLVSSINGIRGKFGQANYAASKAGLIALAKTAALELGAFGVRVNVVAPGFVETAMTATLSEEVRGKALLSSPLGRLAQPQDIADPILFLCSPLARHVTGAVLPVDGGQGVG